MPEKSKNYKLIILVEGPTEKILLPVFAKAAGLDFNEHCIKVISSGGKNRIIRIYKIISLEVDIPVLMLFDSDAEKMINSNIDILKDTDDAYVISKGEFEDILPEELIYQALNDQYRLIGGVSPSEIKGKNHKTQVLTDLYRTKGFGDFKKAEFAHILVGYIKNESDLSEELKDIVEVIRAKI